MLRCQQEKMENWREKSKEGGWFSVSVYIPPGAEGLSHGLKNKKSRYPNGYLDFLVRRKGLEPPTLGTGIRCSIH